MLHAACMNKLALIIASLFSLSAVAAQLPFGPSEEAAILAIQSKQLPSSAKGVVRAVWNPSGNSSHGSSTVNSGVQGLGVTLPAGALITDSYLYVVTAPTHSTPVARVGFQCEDSNNILAQTDLQGKAAGSIIAGIQRGVGASTFAGGPSGQGAVAGIALPCEVSASISTNAYDAGKVILFLEYVLAE